MTAVEHLALYEEIAVRLGGALRAARLYAHGHPKLAEHAAGLLGTIRQLHARQPTILIGFVGGDLIADDTPLARGKAGHADLTREMEQLGIHRLLLERGVTLDEITGFVQTVASASPSPPSEPGGGPVELDVVRSAHLRAGRIPIDPDAGRCGASTVRVREMYDGSVSAARTLWESAQTEGTPDLPTAQDTVEHLAGAVGSSGSLMLALTGMKDHDDYTFTHMVNVAILTLAQAQALGVEGEQLRTLGLAGLLHDIGKVRTPAEILAKPAALTDREFAIIKRHTVDGATILCRTPEMPRIAPIVALEHHLWLDGSGYPEGIARRPLNLATMLCGIADVYDAMRSQRRYRAAQPSERVVAIMQGNDGRRFDQHLLRRFIHLLGVYPPGTLVRLSSGEVGVVLETDGADPQRPTVQVVVDAAGRRLERPLRRRLSQSGDDDDVSVVAPLDPAEHQIDTVGCLAAAAR